MSLINSFTHIQENWKFVIICVQNQWGVVHPWHGTVANLWGRHKDFTEFNENLEKSYLLNGLSNIVKFFTVWFLKLFCIKWIHIFFWVQCSFKIMLDIKFWRLIHEHNKLGTNWRLWLELFCQAQNPIQRASVFTLFCPTHNSLTIHTLCLYYRIKMHNI